MILLANMDKAYSEVSQPGIKTDIIVTILLNNVQIIFIVTQRLIKHKSRYSLQKSAPDYHSPWLQLLFHVYLSRFV